MQAAVQALIPVFTGTIHDEQAPLIDARTLHRFLGIDTEFRKWIARRIEEYGFQEGEDFRSFLAESSGGRRSRDYHITLDMAKELSMVERNDKGRQARRYFIECEKRLQQIAPQEVATIRGQTIGTDGFHCLAAVVDGKVRHLPAAARRGAKNHIWSQVHKAFSVVTAEDIPASQIDSARNFIAAYHVKEGEWLPKEEKKLGSFVLDQYAAQEVAHLIHYVDWVGYRWEQGISEGLKAMNPKFHASTKGFFWEMKTAAQRLEQRVPELLAYFHHEDCGFRPHEAITKGYPVGHPAD